MGIIYMMETCRERRCNNVLVEEITGDGMFMRKDDFIGDDFIK